MFPNRIAMLSTLALVVAIVLGVSSVGTTSVEARPPWERTPTVAPTITPIPTPSPPPDTTPPDPVTNLAIDTLATTHQSITLTWTATGDDGASGQASTYLVRFALDGQMTEAKWDAEPLNIATTLSDPYAVPHPNLVVEPAPSGEAESVEFAGLAAGTTYYFGIKACDEAGNCSTVAAAQGEETDAADPGEWAIDNVNDDAWGVNGGHRKDVDALDTGQVGLWYADGGDFYHSYRGTSGLWQHETVNGGVDDTCHSFAYSPSGDVWASTCVNGSLEVMHKDAGGTWVYEEVDGGDANAVQMDHLPDTGQPVMTFRRPDLGQVLYAWRTEDTQGNATWHVDVVAVTAAVTPPCNPHLAFDPADGHPAILYAVLRNGNYEIYFAENTGSGWTDISESLVTQGPHAGIGSVDLAYHPIDGNPVIVHMGYYNDGVHYLYRTASGWSEPEHVDAVSSADTGGYNYAYGMIGLAFGDDGTAYVGYMGNGAYGTFRLFANDGTGWRFAFGDAFVPPDEVGPAGLLNDRAVNPANGMPAFAYGRDPIRIVERIPPDPGVSVGPVDGLETTEGGAQATFGVRLDTEPEADVTITLSASDTSEGTVWPSSLTFTSSNWNLVQTATVTGVDDSVLDGDATYTIVTGPAASADLDYDALDPADVAATNLDDDATLMHVGDLDGSGSSRPGQWWAEVAILVHDADHQPVADATVSGSWIAGASGTGSCSTNGSGQCTVTSPKAGMGTRTITFTVTDASHATFVYSATDNHDPDGDSDGTTISVSKP